MTCQSPNEKPSETTEARFRRRIRVLHLGSPTGLYGAERWILALIKYLSPDHVESWVGVVSDSPRSEAPLCNAAAKLGFKTCEFESSGKISLTVIRALREFLVANKIGILHTHGYKTDIIGRLAARGTKCKSVATPHGWGASPGIKVKLYELMDRFALRYFHAVVPLSKEMYQRLHYLDQSHAQLELIENGVDLEEIESVQSAPSNLSMLKKTGTYVIGYVGRLDRAKRIDTLVRAAHRLAIGGKYLCIVGEGPERSALESLAGSLFKPHEYEFMGFRDDRISLMREFDIFVLPSEHEGIPRCLMEAMASGVATIASDIPGCRELVLHEQTGLLFKAGNASALESQMRKVFENPEKRKKFAISGQKHVQLNFSACSMAQRYEVLYDRLIGGMVGRAASQESA